MPLYIICFIEKPFLTSKIPQFDCTSITYVHSRFSSDFKSSCDVQFLFFSFTSSAEK